MRLILKTIIWFSFVLYLIAEDRGMFEQSEASFPKHELSVESLLQAQSLLDRASGFCENRPDECRRLGELVVEMPIKAPRTTGENDISD